MSRVGRFGVRCSCDSETANFTMGCGKATPTRYRLDAAVRNAEPSRLFGSLAGCPLVVISNCVAHATTSNEIQHSLWKHDTHQVSQRRSCPRRQAQSIVCSFGGCSVCDCCLSHVLCSGLFFRFHDLHFSHSQRCCFFHFQAIPLRAKSAGLAFPLVDIACAVVCVSRAHVLCGKTQ